MGKVITRVKLSNNGDIEASQRGFIPESQIRSMIVEALVDTGATYPCITQDIAEKLGLRPYKVVTANYADGSKAQKMIYKGLQIDFIGLDRGAECMCLVEPKSDRVLIGQVPLEYTDLHVNCGKGILEVNPLSPEMPLVEVF